MFGLLNAHPFTPPTRKPATKYFCRKGYSRIIGPMVAIAVAKRNVFEGTLSTPVGNPLAPKSLAAEILFTICTMIYCNV